MLCLGHFGTFWDFLRQFHPASFQKLLRQEKWSRHFPGECGLPGSDSSMTWWHLKMGFMVRCWKGIRQSNPWKIRWTDVNSHDILDFELVFELFRARVPNVYHSRCQGSHGLIASCSTRRNGMMIHNGESMPNDPKTWLLKKFFLEAAVLR